MGTIANKEEPVDAVVKDVVSPEPTEKMVEKSPGSEEKVSDETTDSLDPAPPPPALPPSSPPPSPSPSLPTPPSEDDRVENPETLDVGSIEMDAQDEVPQTEEKSVINDMSDSGSVTRRSLRKPKAPTPFSVSAEPDEISREANKRMRVPSGGSLAPEVKTGKMKPIDKRGYCGKKDVLAKKENFVDPNSTDSSIKAKRKTKISSSFELLKIENYMPESSFKRLKCDLCHYEAPSPGLLDIHRQKRHHQMPIPSCHSCKVVFRRIVGLVSHWRSGSTHIKLRKGEKLIGCDICDAFNIINGFRNKEELKRHTKEAHGPEVLVDSTNFKKPKCPLCYREFTYRKGTIEHMQIIHGEHLVELVGETDPKDRQKIARELNYLCHHDGCGKNFKVKKSLLQHMENFHKDYSGYSQARPGSPITLFSCCSVPLNEYLEKLSTDPEHSPVRRKPKNQLSPISPIKELPPPLKETPGKRLSFKRKASSGPKNYSIDWTDTSAELTPGPPPKKKAKTSTTSPVKKQLQFKKSVEEVVNEYMEHLRILSPKNEKETKASEKDGGGSGVSFKVQSETPVTSEETTPMDTKENTPNISENEDESKQPEKRVQRKKSGRRKAFRLSMKINKSKKGAVVEMKENKNEVGVGNGSEELEKCVDENCTRQFRSYFGMMRHHAFSHRAQQTAEFLKLKLTA